MKVHFSAARGDWQTPDDVLELVRKVGPIVCDPCTCGENPTGAQRFFTYSGLVEPWEAGLVYANPPYGRQLPLWVKKAIHEAALGSEIVLLVPSRTDTQWFRSIVETACAIAFWHGRIRFRGARASAPFPSLFAYWGTNTQRFADAFDSKAEVWHLV